MIKYNVKNTTKMIEDDTTSMTNSVAFTEISLSEILNQKNNEENLVRTQNSSSFLFYFSFCLIYHLKS